MVAYHARQQDSRAIKYVLEHEGVPGVNRLYPDHLLPGVWRVRFFRPLHKEEYQVDVDPGDGSVYAVRHHLEEEAPGADLGEEEARAIAAAHLDAHGLASEEFDLKEASAEKLEARRDHRFIWEAREGDPRNVGELKYRCEVTVAGDQPAKLKRYLKLPESWVRARKESTTLRAVLEGTGIAVVTGLVLHLLWLLVRRVRGPGLAWAPLLRIGGIACALTLLGWLNGLPTFYRGYPTEYSTTVFLVEEISLAAVQIIAIGLLVVAALALGHQPLSRLEGKAPVAVGQRLPAGRVAGRRTDLRGAARPGAPHPAAAGSLRSLCHQPGPRAGCRSGRVAAVPGAASALPWGRPWRCPSSWAPASTTCAGYCASRSTSSSR